MLKRTCDQVLHVTLRADKALFGKAKGLSVQTDLEIEGSIKCPVRIGLHALER